VDAAHSIVVAAPQRACYDAVRDFESYPHWQRAVKAVEVRADEDLGDGTTRCTYRLDIDPGRFLPGPVKKVLRDQVMKSSVADLKTHLES
jgi:hypothetical protein